MDHKFSKITEVAIVKAETPRECVLKGIDELGGISKYINEGDKVFIQISLIFPSGFPTNANLEVVKAVVQACKDAGAGGVYVGSFPFKGLTVKALSDILGLKKYFANIGADFVFVDNSNYFVYKKKKLRALKRKTTPRVNVNNEAFEVPKILLDSNKVISINQVNVDPLYTCRLSLLNYLSITPSKSQEILNTLKKGKNAVVSNQYKQDLDSNIISVNTIKQPNLVINDLFYILEGAGPYIYKDSTITKTSVMVLGNDAVAVDIVTTKILKLDSNEYSLITKAEEKRLGPADLSQIELSGEKIENIDINIKKCVDKLEDIKLTSFSIKEGQICSGCFKQAYHLLNIMKTNMNKDLKYLTPNNSFLIGYDPPDPTNTKEDNILLFGDCAIFSTRKKEFKIIMKKTKKGRTYKTNKKILKIPGCPPDIFKSLAVLIDYYGESEVPMLNLYLKTLSSYITDKVSKKLRLWEVL